jgi:hypothetical protein
MRRGILPPAALRAASVLAIALTVAPAFSAAQSVSPTGPRNAASRAAAAASARVGGGTATPAPAPAPPAPAAAAPGKTAKAAPARPGATTAAKPEIAAATPAAAPPKAVPPAARPPSAAPAPRTTAAAPTASGAPPAPAPGAATRPVAGAPAAPPATAGAAAPAPAKPAARAADVGFSREVFDYQPSGRRDPFLSLLESGDLRPAVTDLRLVAVAYDPTGRNSVAIMRDIQTKDQYRAKVGQQIGRLRVTEIHPKLIVFSVEEFGLNRREELALQRDSTRLRE